MITIILLGCQSATPEAPPSTAEPTPTADPAAAGSPPALPAELQPIPDGPVLLWEGMSLQKIAEVGGGAVNLARSPISGEVFYLRPGEGVFQVDLTPPFDTGKVIEMEDITPDGFLTGMTFGPDGALYVVFNRRTSDTLTQAGVRRGRSGSDGSYSWETVVTTEPYPASNTNFDHNFNGIVVSDDNRWIFLNSGSRTDHGEVQDTGGAFPETREVPMTSAIYRLPADGVDLELSNDAAVQAQQGYLFADGVRNAYDLAFAPNGDLLAVENGPDADYPEELNWIREGHHYGFPWRFGTDDNPQQEADYDPAADRRLSQDFVAVQGGTYQNDPTFPPPPQPFTDPIVNVGPDAAQYRTAAGEGRNAAAEGKTLSTFTPHRSPLGLVILPQTGLPAYLDRGDGDFSLLVASWGAAGGDLSDQGQDLLHLSLTKTADSYEAVTTQIARDFRRPIDAILIDNRLYILEWDGAGIIWELTFN